MNSSLIIHKRKNSNTKSTNKYENIILFALAIELSIVRLCWQLFNASFGQIMISFVCLLNSEKVVIVWHKFRLIKAEKYKCANMESSYSV